MKYTITFKGRLIGALGILSTATETVEAPTFEAARLKLYDKYEHVMVLEVRKEE